jgi:hypothetical protein
LNLSLEEFEELTPGQFQALCKRRNIRIKYERFANAQTAAAVYNSRRQKVEDPMIEAMDFVRNEKQAGERESLRKARTYAQRTIGSLPMGTPMEKVLEVRRKAIADLKASGRKDAEEIMNEMWPTLKPKE